MPAMTGANGVASFAGCKFDKSGTKTVTATAGSVTATKDVAITPAAASKISFSTQPNGGAANALWTRSPRSR
jgi:hypothetical protein